MKTSFWLNGLVALSVLGLSGAAWGDKCVTLSDSDSSKSITADKFKVKVEKKDFDGSSFSDTEFNAETKYMLRHYLDFRPRNGNCFVSLDALNSPHTPIFSDLDHPGCDSGDWGTERLSYYKSGAKGLGLDKTLDYQYGALNGIKKNVTLTSLSCGTNPAQDANAVCQAYGGSEASCDTTTNKCTTSAKEVPKYRDFNCTPGTQGDTQCDSVAKTANIGARGYCSQSRNKCEAYSEAQQRFRYNLVGLSKSYDVDFTTRLKMVTDGNSNYRLYSTPVELCM
jgi:hypothetical protein